jgi:RNA polymerase sigma-70 factor (ECF subfamily)
VDDGAREDQQLVMRVASGDQNALGTLYDRHGPTMMAIGLKILKNPREAEDLLHDVFVEAWRRANTYDPKRGSVRAWLHLRMRSRCLDRVKSARWSRSQPLPERESQMGATSQAGIETGADASRLRAALAELPEEQRTVLILGYFEGLSSSEIAMKIGVPIGTVKSRVAAAMGKMRKAMEAT